MQRVHTGVFRQGIGLHGFRDNGNLAQAAGYAGAAALHGTELAQLGGALIGAAVSGGEFSYGYSIAPGISIGFASILTTPPALRQRISNRPQAATDTVPRGQDGAPGLLADNPNARPIRG